MKDSLKKSLVSVSETVITFSSAWEMVCVPRSQASI